MACSLVKEYPAEVVFVAEVLDAGEETAGLEELEADENTELEELEELEVDEATELEELEVVLDTGVLDVGVLDAEVLDEPAPVGLELPPGVDVVEVVGELEIPADVDDEPAPVELDTPAGGETDELTPPAILFRWCTAESD